MNDKDVKVDELFDHAWQVPWGRRRVGLFRKIIMWAFLLLLIVIIAGYSYVTDSERVRSLAQDYLSKLLGGPVQVDRASLSIFEGLRLDGVRVKVDDNDAPDSMLFSTRSLQIQYDPKMLVLGRIEATRILAIEPRVNLCENVDAKQWNFERLTRPKTVPVKPAPATKPDKITLPEILLRNARIDYAQVVNSKHTSVGTMTLEGQLTPDKDNLYRFRLQSRGTSNGVGPLADGWLTFGGQQMNVTLKDIEFVQDLKTVLPAVVRQFWEDHELAGRIGETRIAWLRKPDGKSGFKVETDLDGVKMAFRPTEWMTTQERHRFDRTKKILQLLQSPLLGSSRIAGLVEQLITPSTVTLDEVDGTFVFTDEQINVDNLVARVENNRFKLSAHVTGYNAGAAAKLRIESLSTENIYIPDSPRYISAMPWPVREIYYRFRPQGASSFWLEMERDPTSEHPKLSGELSILEGRFIFDRFPYPVERAHGKIAFGTDPATGREMMKILSIQGNGPIGSINEKATLNVSGTITPLDDEAGADIVVRGIGWQSERLLIESLPPLTKKTVKSLDPEHTGLLPTFAGDMVVTIHRPIGIAKPWTITTDIDLKNATGKIKAFPYPLENVTAKLSVHDDFIDIINATARRAGGEATISGRIDWSKHYPNSTEVLIQPNLKITARNVPIDDALLNALPPARRSYIAKLSPTGTIDVDGTLGVVNEDSEEISQDLKIKLNDVSVMAGKCKLEHIAGALQVGTTGLKSSDLSAVRGDTKLAGRLTVDWSKPNTSLSASATVTNTGFDEEVLSTIPEGAAEVIRNLKPQGTVDVAIDYAGSVDSQDKDEGYRVAITARKTSLVPPIIPLRVDSLAGQVVVEPGRVKLVDLSGKYKDSVITTTGEVLTNDAGSWSLAVGAKDLTITDEVRKALPVTLARLATSLDLNGTYSFDCPKLVIKNSNSSTQPSEKTPSIADFTASATTQNGSMNVGVGLTEIKGSVQLTGVVKNESLDELAGDVTFDSLKVAGRDATDMSAHLVKPAGKDLFQIGKLKARIAGGEVAGQIDTQLADKRSRYGLSLVLHNAKVGELTGDTEKKIDGTLTASLSMDGFWDDPNDRRGRGDITVEGKAMYKVPVIFGLMQIANLSLPIDAPIQQAGIKYSMDGQRVTFEQIDLRSSVTSMQGNGWLDFKDKSVRMTLSVASSAADNVPLFGELFKGARQDLLQIQVRGTLQAPKVGASMFNTFNTTVDEVLKGDRK